jgi:hypothetical protein
VDSVTPASQNGASFYGVVLMYEVQQIFRVQSLRQFWKKKKYQRIFYKMDFLIISAVFTAKEFLCSKIGKMTLSEQEFFS